MVKLMMIYCVFFYSVIIFEAVDWSIVQFLCVFVYVEPVTDKLKRNVSLFRSDGYFVKVGAFYPIINTLTIVLRLPLFGNYKHLFHLFKRHIFCTLRASSNCVRRHSVFVHGNTISQEGGIVFKFGTNINLDSQINLSHSVGQSFTLT